MKTNIKKIYHEVRSGAEYLQESVKIKNKIKMIENELCDLFCEYGAEYYNKNTGLKFDNELLCEIEKNIADKKDELCSLHKDYNTIRNLNECAECGKVSSKDFSFCPYCGNKTPDEKEKPIKTDLKKEDTAAEAEIIEPVSNEIKQEEKNQAVQEEKQEEIKEIEKTYVVNEDENFEGQ